MALVGVAAALSATERVPSPQALYRALLTDRLSQSELPAGFSSPRTKAKRPEPGGNPQRHHVVGEVEIDLNGGRARIVYAIFPTRADALANHAAGVQGLKSIKGITKVQSPVPGFPKPSLILDASLKSPGRYPSLLR
jgi:hypothetical protein